jgi:hypothetical protein
MCSQRAVLKAASKYYKAVMKEIKGRVDPKVLKETGEQRTICSSFALYSESILEQLSKSGFDIYTGAYSTNNKVLPNKGAGSGATEKEFEVVYETGSKVEKLTGDAVRQAVINNDNSVLDNVTLKKLATIESIEHDIAKYTAANKGLKEAQLMLENFEKLLWIHNASILNNLAISSDEAKLWKPYASRAKAYDVYQSTTVEKLIIKLKGIRMA